MAEVIIRIWDDENDLTKASVQFNPPLLAGRTSETLAQLMGLAISEKLMSAADGPKDEVKVNWEQVKP